MVAEEPDPGSCRRRAGLVVEEVARVGNSSELDDCADALVGSDELFGLVDGNTGVSVSVDHHQWAGRRGNVCAGARVSGAVLMVPDGATQQPVVRVDLQLVERRPDRWVGRRPRFTGAFQTTAARIALLGPVKPTAPSKPGLSPVTASIVAR